MKVFLKVLGSIVVGILALLGAICVTPLIVIYMLISLPVIVIGSIWETNHEETFKK